MMDSPKRFSTFDGVFLPTFLTIIGVILYLRLGWVVGNAGISGAFLIIILSHIATITTGLAMASMTTNVKIGDGGFYSIISRSLGPEIGGAIGISLYLSQTLSIALYIIGFTELWTTLFPTHNFKIVSTLVLLLILALSYIDAKIALKSQYFIFIAIILSLVSLFSGNPGSITDVSIFPETSKHSFWEVFAVFFPAVTGISAGASLSGELKNPRKSIPTGMLFAITAGFFIYMGVAFWLGISAEREVLKNDTMVILHIAKWKWAVILGIMGATLSSAIGSILGAPRILLALGQDRIVPLYKVWRKRSRRGEPQNSILLTALIAEISLLLWDLNSIAPLITMFFLITYSMINVSVFIEKVVGVTSFRPSFKIPSSVSLLGGAWCIVVMFLVDSVFAIVSFILISIFYIVQVKRELKVEWGDIRPALFVSIAEWALKKSSKIPATPKTWKPNLMIPIEEPSKWKEIMGFVRDIVFPNGTLRLFSVVHDKQELPKKISKIAELFFKEKKLLPGEKQEKRKKLKKELEQLSEVLKKEGIFTAEMVIEASSFIEGIDIITQVMKGMFFPPNILFLKMSSNESKDKLLEELIAVGIKEKLGIAVLGLDPQRMFGEKRFINLWIRDKSPNQNLATLLSLELYKEWGNLRLIRVTDKKEKVQMEREDLKRIIEEQRLPSKSECIVMVGNFYEKLKESPPADVNIFGISEKMSAQNMRKIIKLISTSVVFTKGSGDENPSF